MGGRLQFQTALHEDSRALPESLRTGPVWLRSEHDPWVPVALGNLTKPDTAVLTEHVLPQAPEALARLETGRTILGIGPGGGYAPAHFAVRFPPARVGGIELDEEDVYDVIVMNIVLHETGGPDEYRNVMRRCRRALRAGGTVLVSKLPYPDSPTAYRGNPVHQMLSGVQIHDAQVGFGAITQNELRDLLAGQDSPTSASLSSRSQRAS